MTRRTFGPLAVFCLIPAIVLADPIPGLFNTGVNNSGGLLASGTIDPHYRILQGPTPNLTNAFVLNDVGFPINPWIANGPNSKWIAPQASQATGNDAGDWIYRTTFDLTGLDPATAVLTGRWTSDNTGPAVLLNGAPTGVTGDGNFGVFSAVFTISAGFVDGINTLDFVVNNAGPGINPTGVRVEISGTADRLAPPGTPPSITQHPVSVTNGLGESATFSVGVYGSRPFSYQWRRNNNPVANATNATLVINGLSGQNAGEYDVVVTNPFGTATSLKAVLTVVMRSPAELSYEPAGPSSRRTGLVFSELMYHPKDRVDDRNLEFIEIYNSNPFPEDVGGYRLTGVVNYTFPMNTTIGGNEYLVIAANPTDVMAVYGISGVIGGLTNAFPNSGGLVQLRKRSGAIILELPYSDDPPPRSQNKHSSTPRW